MKIKLAFFLLLITSLAYAAQVDTVSVYSASMKKTIKNVVIKPDRFRTGETEYPLLFLLHGAGDNYSGWVKRVPEIVAYADQYNVLIVCPDGGLTSWYIDSPIDETMQFETYINGELYSYVMNNYPVSKAAKQHAITGNSMGGHGAVYSALRYPQHWGAVGCLSGGVDFRPFPDSWDIKKRLGTYAENPQVWDEHVVINQIDKIKPGTLSISIDCGVDDFFIHVNRNLHQALMDRKIPHDYIERPGEHNWRYWSNALKHQISYFDTCFRP